MGDFENPILSTDPTKPQTTLLDAVALGSGDVLTINPIALVPDGYTTALIDVRQWAFLNVYIEPGNLTPLLVRFRWFADNAGTLQLGEHIYITKNATRVVDSVANFGPFLQVSFTWSGGATDYVKLWIGGRTNAMSHGVGYFANPWVSQQAISYVGLAVGAGAIVTTDARYVQSGWATLTVESNAPGVDAAVYYLSGAFLFQPVPIARASTAANKSPIVTFAAPPALMQLIVTNGSGVATNISAGVMFGPTP